MQISVQGEQRVRVAPERAALQLTVAEEGTDRAKVIDAATSMINEISAELDALAAAGAVEHHSLQPLRTYAWKKNRTSPERVTASVDALATFSDFEALGRFTADVGARPGVRLGWVRWSLTDATADRLRDECIEGAVTRARERAAAMARAAGAGAVEIVEIADPGLLGSGDTQVMLGGGPEMFGMARSSMLKSEAPEQVQIRPEEIEVAVGLQLRFVTKDA